MVPILGNICVGIFDYWLNPEKVANDPLRFLRFAPYRIKNNKDVVMAAVQYSPYNLLHVGDHFENDKGIILAAVQKVGFFLRCASDNLKNDLDIIQAANQQGASACA